MLIWILAILLFGVIGALGYLQGAVRLLVSLVGMFLGALLAMPLAPTIKPLIPLVGLKHPVWSWVLPPILIFLLIFGVFMILAWVVHRKVELYYKYRTDDFQRIQWQQLNKSLGLCVGLVMACAWLMFFGVIVYSLGYLTVQVAGEDSNSTAVRMLNTARRDLAGTGLDKTVAALDPMPAKYYEASDILGLMYHNPILMGRLSQYPPFLMMGERPEFQEMATDTDYNNLILSKGEFTEILKHPKTQAVLTSAEIMDFLAQQDLKDLRQYLETGVSPKFSEEKILGRWKLDAYATMAQERKARPDITAAELLRLKKVINDLSLAFTFIATTDNKAVLKFELPEEIRQALQAAADAQNAQAQSGGAATGMSPELSARYGLGQRRAAPAPSSEPAAAPVQLNLSATGTWERQDGRYELKLASEQGKEEVVRATADEDRLVINTTLPNTQVKRLVFARAE